MTRVYGTEPLTIIKDYRIRYQSTLGEVSKFYLDMANKGKLIDRGLTERDGSLPVNASGGCFGAGMALGPIGVKQAVEMFWQLRDEADKHMKGSVQVKGAEKGLIHAESGYGVYSVVHILER